MVTSQAATLPGGLALFLARTLGKGDIVTAAIAITTGDIDMSNIAEEVLHAFQ